MSFNSFGNYSFLVNSSLSSYPSRTGNLISALNHYPCPSSHRSGSLGYNNNIGYTGSNVNVWQTGPWGGVRK
jgi:hypothetical protein